MIAVIIGAYQPSSLFALVLTGLMLSLANWVASLASAVVLARRIRSSYVLTRYNHLAVYAAFALASSVATNIFASLIRGYVVEPFHISSGSMAPTLVPGDQVFATKVGAAERRQRGDVVVYTNPLRANVDYIHRIIGLAGDRIRIANARIYLNGEEQKHLLDPSYALQLGLDRETETAQVYQESLGARSYRILLSPWTCGHPHNASCTFLGGQEFVVPRGHVFVMGDNRDRSADSRFGFGVEGKGLEFVPLANIKGQAVVIWLSFSFVDGLRWNRIGQTL